MAGEEAGEEDDGEGNKSDMTRVEVEEGGTPGERGQFAN